MAVVDLLEVVDVDDGDHQRFVVGWRVVDGVIEEPIEPAAVRRCLMAWATRAVAAPDRNLGRPTL